MPRLYNVRMDDARTRIISVLTMCGNMNEKRITMDCVILRVAYFLAIFLALTATASAVPSIISWDNNYTNNQDIMFSVTQGSVINLNITTNEIIDTHTWLINKVDQSNNANSFTWTVPKEKDIYEVHLKVSNADGEDHIEWVISTLNSSEAPDIFDYFADKKTQSRTDTDPWGRPLPEWEASGLDINNRYLLIEDGGSGALMTTPCNVAYGTWKWKWKYDKGGQHFEYGNPILIESFLLSTTEWLSHSTNRFYKYWEEVDHHHLFQFSVDSKSENIVSNLAYCHIDCWSSGFMLPEGDTDWHDVTVIRTEDGWFYTFIDGELLPDTLDRENSLTSSNYFGLRLRDYDPTPGSNFPYVDSIEIYDHKYLWPEKKAVYGEYPYSCHWISMGEKEPVGVKEGIIVHGKVGLADIAEQINNPSLFTYNPATKIAICYTNLVIEGGTELIIENETLKMHCDYGGEHEIAVMSGGSINLDNATITSDTGNYYLWRFTVIIAKECFNDNSDHNHFRGFFIAKNSVINNTANMYLEGIKNLSLINTKITNLVEANVGDYSETHTYEGEYQAWVNEPKAVWFYNRVPTHNFEIDGCEFRGKNTPVDIMFMGGDPCGEINIYDTKFVNTTVKVKKGMRYSSQSHQSNPYSGREISLVNCEFDNLEFGSDITKILVKYYLDVKIVTADGTPVDNADVTVINEADSDYPPKSKAEDFVWTNTFNEGYFHHDMKYKKYFAKSISTTETKNDGHTSLPLDEANTFVIADYAEDQTSQTNFTYTITVSKDGKTASMNGLDIDENWYREDPNIPIKTVVCNIDTGSCWVEDEATGTISGTVTNTTGALIHGSTVSINGYSNTTNSTGGYTITLPVGNYTVTASATGYQSQSKPAEATANQTTTIDFQLTTETTPPTITAHSPTGTNVLIGTTITVTFSETMNQTSAEDAFSISPPVTGSFTWDRDKMIFTPSANLAYETTYTVNISAEAEDFAGNNLESSYIWQFTTGTFSSIVYVASDGSGDYNCDGTDDQIEINEAINYVATHNDFTTVHLKSGTYTIDDVINIYSNMTFGGDGEENTIIELDASNSRTGWYLFDVDNLHDIALQSFTVDGNKIPWVTSNGVDAFHIYNSNNVWFNHVTIRNVHTDGFEFYQSSDCSVTNCKVVHSGHDGIMNWFCVNMTYTDNYFEDLGNVGVRIANTKNSRVERNICICNDCGISFQGTNPSWPTENNLIKDNYIDNKMYGGDEAIPIHAAGTGIIRNQTFIGNIIAHSGTYLEMEGFRIYTSDSGRIENIYIINNVIRDCRGEGGIYAEGVDRVTNIIAKNNIIVGSTYGVYGKVVSSYNNFWNNALNYGGGASAGTGDIFVDPLFADPENEDFHLKSAVGRWSGSAWVNDDVTSLCIDTGDPDSDYDNEPPPNGSRINMGAYGNTAEASKSAGGITTYTISGYVTYINGTGIHNAYITNRATGADTYTNADGYYISTGLVNGTYNITASKSGFHTNYTIQTISGADIQHANVTLIVDPAPLISDVQNSSVRTTSAVIIWTTNEPATSQVEYGLNTDYGSNTTIDTNLVITHSVTLTGLASNTTYHYRVKSEDAANNLAISDDYTFTTLPGGEVVTITGGTDNRLREASPDTVLNGSMFIDVGRLIDVGNYRGVIWFDLSQFNSTDQIESAALSLFWYYQSHNQNTDVSIYRPADWDTNYATWNTRMNSVAWNHSGGDWYDRNNAVQGTSPYAAATFAGDPDHEYHNFDVTELVQRYVNGTYNNTGFFIKANEIDDTYIAFRSSDCEDANERPKLTISYSHGAPPENRPPTLAPINDRSAIHTATTSFPVTASDPDNDPLTFSAQPLPPGAHFNASNQTFIWTPTYENVSWYRHIKFEVSDGQLTDSEEITIFPRWDVDRNGIVNDADRSLIAAHFEGPVSACEDCDVNRDSEINIIDYSLAGQHIDENWGVGIGATPITGVAISPESQTVAPGESFSVNISVTPDTGMAGMQFDLVFNASLVRVNSVLEGDLLKQNGTDTAFVEGTVDNTAGTITNVFGCILGPYNVTAPGTFAIISMTAMDTSGTSNLDLVDVIVSDPYGYATDVELASGTVTVIEGTSPVLTDPGATPPIIPDDTDNDPGWGETSQLSITATDDDGIAGVTIDLSPIGGSPAQPMNHIGGNIWSVTTNASNGTAGFNGTAYTPHFLRITATDIHGNSNTSTGISLTVVRNGDVNSDGEVDYFGDVVHLIRYLRGAPGFNVTEGIADVTSDSVVNDSDVTYLANHIYGAPGYEILH